MIRVDGGGSGQTERLISPQPIVHGHKGENR